MSGDALAMCRKLLVASASPDVASWCERGLILVLHKQLIFYHASRCLRWMKCERQKKIKFFSAVFENGKTVQKKNSAFFENGKTVKKKK